VLEAGLLSPDGADGQHEHALMMLGLARIPGDQSTAREMRRRSREILERLGVVAVPMAKLVS
jgi:hypothetical protein